ncbi:sulfatase-like hydrolase/transferase [Flavicella sediminum]|uniref:sulfatase-like hydrolase/transferase n=1 Tax=Flavicella sediminum TaxID=2585141 RepID=UPI00112147F3|nr:sulfatase-like hydrolase/transferase [Flavicella sediminum]
MKFSNSKILVLLVLLTCLSCKTKKTSVATNSKQPNIIVLLCDDLGYGDLSTFGHPIIQTKNLDKLAKTGIKLTNFYSTAPVCSPSRVGLLTGRSPNKAGVYDFIPGYKKSEDLRDLVHMQAHEVTIPSLLKKAGYATCLVGKWHCSSRFNSKAQPQPNDFGFDHWFATHNNAAPSHQNPKNFVRNGNEVGVLEGFSSQIVVEEAMNWLDKKEGNAPFFLEVAFHEPHEPIASPEDLVQKYLPKAKTREEAEYFANVENVDIAVGRLLSYLKEKNLDENTLIVFTSDNGPETLMRYYRAKHSYGSPGELKGMKLWTNEAGFRVPCIVNWLGKETYSGTSDKVISALDLLPTFSELAGVELPERGLDGESISSFLRSGNFERSKPLIWAFYDAINDRRVAMRSGDWKIMGRLVSDENDKELPHIHNLYKGNETFVKNAKLTDFVLFNLKKDLSESEDLSVKEPEVFKNMKIQFEAAYKELLKESHIWNRTK